MDGWKVRIKYSNSVACRTVSMAARFVINYNDSGSYETSMIIIIIQVDD